MKTILHIKYCGKNELTETIRSSPKIPILKLYNKCELKKLDVEISGEYFKEKNKTYNIVIIDDDELNELERKAKE